MRLSTILSRIVNRFSKPKPKFKPGTAVQPISSNDYMIVKWSKVLENREVIYFCNWYDNALKSSNSQLFKESELKFYDWSSFHKSFCESINKAQLETSDVTPKK